jgi:hypothetical protein
MCFRSDCILLCGRTGAKKKKSTQTPAYKYLRNSFLLAPNWVECCFWRCHPETIQPAKVRTSAVSVHACMCAAPVAFTKSPDCNRAQMDRRTTLRPATAKLHRTASEAACLISGAAADLCEFQKNIQYEPFTQPWRTNDTSSNNSKPRETAGRPTDTRTGAGGAWSDLHGRLHRRHGLRLDRRRSRQCLNHHT